MQSGDLFKFCNSGETGLVLCVTSSLYQVDEIEEEIRFLHQNGQVFDRAYMYFSGREYIGMREVQRISRDITNENG